MPLNTIQHVRSALKAWGNFWRSKEYGSGYASVSVVARICENLEKQVFASSDLHLFMNEADSLFVPPHIEKTGIAVSKLPMKQRLALSDFYIKGKGEDNYYKREAENSLLYFLSDSA